MEIINQDEEIKIEPENIVLLYGAINEKLEKNLTLLLKSQR